MSESEVNQIVHSVIDPMVRDRNAANGKLITASRDALKLADVLYGEIEQLPNSLRHVPSRQNLEKHGVRFLNERDWDVFTRVDSTQEHRNKLSTVLAHQVRIKIDEAVDPVWREGALATAEEMERDAQSLTVIQPLEQKYKVEFPLVRALQTVIARLRADCQRSFNTLWHPDPRVAISQALLPEDRPLVVYEPNPAPSLAAPAAPVAARTALGIATARAA